MSASEREEGKSSMENVDPPSDQALQKANSCIKEAYEILKQESLRVQREKEALDSVAKKLEHVHFASTVKLNVGGQFFTTSLQTLTKDPGSMLHAMFSGRFDTKPGEDGCYFIDRDGTHFRYILNYLRTGELVVPADPTVQRELEIEARFYQIRGLLEELHPKVLEVLHPKVVAFEESTILKEGHHELLASWLGPQQGSWSLLYRASGEWKPADFHSRCDNKGATVTIVSSGDLIFGGFTEQSWEGHGTSKTCSQAFLFSLVGPSGLGPTKLALNPGHDGNAIFCNMDYGPIFGTGQKESMYDLLLSPTSRYSSLSVYKCPPGQGNTTFLAGANSFTLSAFEVFGLKK